MKFDLDLWTLLRWRAHVCRRCGDLEKAEELEAEADSMEREYKAFLDKQAGLA